MKYSAQVPQIQHLHIKTQDKLIRKQHYQLHKHQVVVLDMRYDEFRQGAISKIDLTLPVDSTRVGGSGFKVFGNTAQGGDTASITLAASK